MATQSNERETTREQILEGALQVFAERGYSGATIAAIAEAAGVTKSLVHHHIGNKDDVWEAVREHVFQSYFEAQRNLIMSSHGDLDVLRRSFRTYFDFFKERPNVARLGQWMYLQPKDDSKRDVSDGLTQFGVERLIEAQKRGVVREDVHPYFMLLAFFSLIEHWFHAREELGCRYPHGLDDDELGEAYLKAVTDIFIRGISP